MNKMIKRVVAPLALAAGVSGAALMAAPAHATVAPNWSSGSGYKCSNVGLVNAVDCIQVNPAVTVTVSNSPILSGNDISVLENNLNNTKVDVQDIDATVLNFYKSINVPITVQDILVKL